ncbi:MAG: DUF3105 domain-containing protein [Candidatus Rokubacteria bacterium]|nr:DUF3105 domain-containing protein [Candidatus Rokubacteria bacterium]
MTKARGKPKGFKKGSAAAGPRRMSRRTRRQVTWALAVVVILLLAGGGWMWARTGEGRPGEFVPSLGNGHVATPETPHIPYNSDPPTSGPHVPYLAPWGVHTQPIPKELQAHNLEDGGVLVQYTCTDCPELVAKLQAIVARYRDHVILAPYPNMPKRIALTAWTRIDAFDEFDERRIARFIDAYRGIDHHVRY